MFNNLNRLLDMKKIKSITINPLIHNFNELGDLIKFANHNNLTVFFNNTVDFLSGHKEDVHIKDGKKLYDILFIHQLSEEEFKEGIVKINSYNFVNNEYYNKKKTQLISILKNIFNYKIKALQEG
jgi:hypothetical protein